MKKLALYFVLISLLSFGCQGFIDGLVVDVEVPEHEAVLVPYCFVNAEDSSIEIIVQQSQGILDSFIIRPVEDRTVQLYKNGVLWQNFSSSGVYTNVQLLDHPIAADGYGDTYELRVNAPNFEEVTATQMMPTPVEILTIEHLRNVGANISGEISDNTRITFDDPPNEENYYRIVLDVFTVGTMSDGDTVYEARSTGGYTLANTESVSNASGGVVITDKLFDGQRFTIDVGSSPSSLTYSTGYETASFGGTVSAHLFSITRAEYLYLKSLYAYDNAQSNPFAEPTLLYSNTSSGLGMFSMMSVTKKEVEF